MKENLVAEKSFSFAVRIVKLRKYLKFEKQEYDLSKQILRSGTSIGANISEAQQGQTRKDFASKMNIALKECSETKYWLRLLLASDIITEQEGKTIMEECVELEKLLTSIVKTISETK